MRGTNVMDEETELKNTILPKFKTMHEKYEEVLILFFFYRIKLLIQKNYYKVSIKK